MCQQVFVLFRRRIAPSDWLRWLVVWPFVGVLAACGPTSPSDATHVPLGWWGGDHVRLTVNEANAIVEFDCAHGTLDQPVVTDRDGRFDVAGTFVREHGGPSRPDEVLDRHPARYVGVMAGNKMTLTTTTTDEPQTLGPFALVQGVYPKLIKCL